MKARLIIGVLLVMFLELRPFLARAKSGEENQTARSAHILKVLSSSHLGLVGYDAVTAATTSINGPFTVTGVVGVGVTRRLTTAGQIAEYWTVGKNPVAPGLTLNNSSGVISGKPTKTGNFTNTITAWQGFGGFGASVSSTFVFTFTEALTAPGITNQPQDQIVASGTNVIFSVGASGGGLAYDWFFNNHVVSTGTNSQLILTNVIGIESGEYQVVVSNSAAAATSIVAQLLVVPPPAGSNAPQLAVLVRGGSVEVSLGAFSGYVYTLEAADNLTTPNWVAITNAGPSLTNFVLNLLEPSPSGTNRFYRSTVASP